MSVLLTPLHKTIEDINKAYYNTEGLVNPSKVDISTIKSDLASLRLAGAVFIGGGLIGQAGSYLVFYIPYAGPVLGTIGGLASAALAGLGFDMLTASNNLEPYTKNELISKLISNYTKTTITREEFSKTLVNIAYKGTLIGSSVFEYPLANKKPQ